MLAPLPRFLPCGDTALTVEFGETVDPALNARVLALDAALAKAKPEGLIETVPTYRSLLVCYDPVATDLAAIEAAITELIEHAPPIEANARRWRVPVVYGGDFGVDLDEVARRHGLTTDEVIRRHAGGDYRAYMLGFSPGFTYLGGLDPVIATPRRDDPRLVTPAGTVSIGGVQAGIQCLAAPSGWQLLGRTPVRTYHPHREPMFLTAPGDFVTFYPVPAKAWDALDAAAERGELIAELVPA